MAGVIDGKLYVAGGYNAADGSADKLDIYDPATNRWSSGRPLPSARSGAGAAVLGGKLYVIGGFTGESSVQDLTDEVLAYNPKTNQWTTKAPLPTARDGLAAAKIMIAGRLISRRSEGTCSWTRRPGGKPMCTRPDGSVTVRRSSLLAAGLAAFEVPAPSARGHVRPSPASIPAAVVEHGRRLGARSPRLSKPGSTMV
jgi:hypothetical protein